MVRMLRVRVMREAMDKMEGWSERVREWYRASWKIEKMGERSRKRRTLREWVTRG